jgi:hypothetical protein
MIEDDDLRELDCALRRMWAVDVKLLHLRNKLLSRPPELEPTEGNHRDRPIAPDASADAEDQKPAPHASASAYRLLAASLSAGAVRDRLLKKAAAFEREAAAGRFD